MPLLSSKLVYGLFVENAVDLKVYVKDLSGEF